MLVTFTCFAKMTSIFFQALGQPVRATVASLIRDIIFLIPLVIVLPTIFENDTVGTGVIGVLFAAPIADFIAMIISTMLTISFSKNLKKKKKHNHLVITKYNIYKTNNVSTRFVFLLKKL